MTNGQHIVREGAEYIQGPLAKKLFGDAGSRRWKIVGETVFINDTPGGVRWWPAIDTLLPVVKANIIAGRFVPNTVTSSPFSAPPPSPSPSA